MRLPRGLRWAAPRTRFGGFVFFARFVLPVLSVVPSFADRPLEYQRPRYSRDQIEQTLLASGERWLFVYGTRDARATPALHARATFLARRLFAADSAAVYADRDVSATLAAQHSLILIGGPSMNDWTAKLAAALPVQFTRTGFRWQDREYLRPLDVIQLVYPHPLDPRRMVVLIAGNSAEAMAQRAGGFLSGGDDWRIHRDGELARSGSFAQGAGAPWRYDPALDRDRERERESFAGSLVRTAGRGVDVLAPRGVEVTRAVVAGEAVMRALMARGIAPAGMRTPVSLTLYRSLLEKATFTRISRPEHVTDDGAAHAALAEGHNEIDAWSVATAMLRRGGGSLDSRFMVPAGTWLAGRYGGESLARAVSRVAFGRLLPGARDAASADSLWRSPLIWVPARALLVQSVFESAGRGGATALAKLLAHDPPGEFEALCTTAGVDPSRVEQRYRALADSLARAGQRERPAHPAPRRWQSADGFQRGACFAHSLSLERGYLSADAAGELAVLQKMGANWVSVTPFGYLPGLDVPEIHPSAQGGPEEENDESVCEAAARARALGLRVWLKPHLWTRGWVGELKFGPGGWARFFEQYRRFILHYALLAEREGMDGLVVGHELPTATLPYPEQWRRLIAEVRRVYSGTLTYGANWDREVDQVPFWDALDLIGVSFYDPLAAQPTRDIAMLTAGAHKGLERLRTIAARSGKPVVLLEAGYASTTMASVRPWEEDRGTPDVEAQRVCYEALVRALEPEDWVAGAFFWKWTSSPESGGPRDGSFTPRGKPAQEVMARAFREWTGRPVRVLTKPRPTR